MSSGVNVLPFLGHNPGRWPSRDHRQLKTTSAHRLRHSPVRGTVFCAGHGAFLEAIIKGRHSTSGQQGRRTAMNSMSRRSVIRGSLGLAATGALARPYIANAAAATAIVWQVQGFIPEEDAAFRKTVADYEKANGNKIELSVMPFMALN